MVRLFFEQDDTRALYPEAFTNAEFVEAAQHCSAASHIAPAKISAKTCPKIDGNIAVDRFCPAGVMKQSGAHNDRAF